MLTGDFDATFSVAYSACPGNPHRLYFFAKVWDDTLKIAEEDPRRWHLDDSIEVFIDADHSGSSIAGETLEEVGNGQRYIFRIPSEPGQPAVFNNQRAVFERPELNWSLAQTEGDSAPWLEVAWSVDPPGASHGSTNVTWTLEFRCVLWDEYGTSPEASKGHLFEEDQIIHLGVQFNDREPGFQDSTSTTLILKGSNPLQAQTGDWLYDWYAEPAWLKPGLEGAVAPTRECGDPIGEASTAVDFNPWGWLKHRGFR